MWAAARPCSFVLVVVDAHRPATMQFTGIYFL
jgi:hypothetical protein